MRTAELGMNIACDAYGLHSFAESARQMAFACNAVGLPFVVNDIQWHPRLYSIYRKFFRNQFDLTLDRYASTLNVYPINLIRLMPDATKRLLTSNPQYFDRKINVAMWSPDFPRIPSEWISTSRAFDEIWVISEFMRKNMADKLPVPVKRIRYPLFIDEGSIEAKKFREDIPDDVCVFLFAFEYSGGFERKNPVALIEAFKRSFSKSDKALLIIKTVPFFSSSVNPMHTIRVTRLAREKARILKTAVREADKANIRIIDERFTRLEFMSLLASSDCYASMHRAEGFGQVLAQSMYLGKPVIATGYSGNLDYMNKDNSLLLRFELVKVSDSQMSGEGNVWAEPDVDHASQLMRWVYEHRKEARELGVRASKSLQDFTNPQTAGNEIREECARLCVNQ